MFLLEFPQNLIGYVAFKYYTATRGYNYYRYKEANVTHVPGRWGAISLSRFIFADDIYYKSQVIRHEYGHTIQSKKLLLLYIPIIGIPSLVWNKCFKQYRLKNGVSYYDFYPESWANRLGGFDERTYLASLKHQSTSKKTTSHL